MASYSLPCVRDNAGYFVPNFRLSLDLVTLLYAEDSVSVIHVLNKLHGSTPLPFGEECQQFSGITLNPAFPARVSLIALVVANDASNIGSKSAVHI